MALGDAVRFFSMKVPDSECRRRLRECEA